MKTYIYFLITSLSFFRRMGNVSDKRCREDQTNILCPITFFLRKSYRLCDNVEKYGRAGEATDENMAWELDFGCVRLHTHTHIHTQTHTPHTQMHTHTNTTHTRTTQKHTHKIRIYKLIAFHCTYVCTKAPQ